MRNLQFTGVLFLTIFMSCANSESLLNLKGGGFVEVDEEDESILLTLPEKYRFDFDQHVVKQSDTSDSLVDFMNRFGDSLELRVAGHTDSVGTDGYNYELGMERASSIKIQLIERGMKSGEIDLMSFGKSLPMYGSEHGVESVDAAQENRRAELAIRYTEN